MQNYFSFTKKHLSLETHFITTRFTILMEHSHQKKSTVCKTRRAAIQYCELQVAQENNFPDSNISFSNYTEHFFDIDSIWDQDKLLSGTPEHPALSPLYLKKLQSTVRLHLLPYN